MKRSLLIFEPRLGGHHLTWLRYVTEDCLAAGFRLSLAVDLRPGQREKIVGHLAELMDQVTLYSAYDAEGGYQGGSKTRALELLFQESGAEQVLLTNFDEVASSWLRKAACGLYPPACLKGRMHGVYFRPRFVVNPRWPPGNWLKALGFTRLRQQGWFASLLLLDEYLCPRVAAAYPGTRIHFLPDPWSGNFDRDQAQARQQLGIPAERFVFLQYGIGTRRKGLHLVIEAMAGPGVRQGFLLCAGTIEDPALSLGAAGLAARGRAQVLNRYLTPEEEELCFAAADMVLIPYLGHFGSSAVLSRAAAAGKPVIASAEGLIARRVRDHGLGLLFDTGKVTSLIVAMERAMAMGAEEKSRYQQAGRHYAATCTRQAFTTALIQTLLP